MYKIAILLATYNAGKYINEQLDSILNQTISNFELYVHDDGSNDQTIDILEFYAKKNANIHIIKDNVIFHSASNNFFYLMKQIEKDNYDYICFSDQDDIWKPNHIELLLNKMTGLPNNKPCLVHGDSIMIDENNNVINKSFNAYGNIRMERDDFCSVSFHNNVQGSTAMINKKLLNLSNSYEHGNLYMHDWFIACLSSLYGVNSFINETVLLYRQHGKNVVGAQMTRKYISMFSKKKYIEYSKIVNKNLNDSKVQLNVLLKRDANNKSIISSLKFIDSNFFQKVIFILKNKLIKNKGMKSCLGFLLYRR